MLKSLMTCIVMVPLDGEALVSFVLWESLRGSHPPPHVCAEMEGGGLTSADTADRIVRAKYPPKPTQAAESRRSLCRHPVPGAHTALASELWGSSVGTLGRSTTTPSGNGAGVSHPLARLSQNGGNGVVEWLNERIDKMD